jgi:hypothetical protein
MDQSARETADGLYACVGAMRTLNRLETVGETMRATLNVLGYHQARLAQKDAAPVDAYLGILCHCTQWIAERPLHGRHFELTQLTQTSVELYLSSLKEQGYSVSRRTTPQPS